MTKFLVVIAMMMCICASAQTSGYRDTGYEGNIYVFHSLNYSGIGTSQGYMFNEHHYLGASVEFGATLFSYSSFPFQSGSASIDYRAYLSQKSSTPVLGFKFGYMLGHYNPSENLVHGFQIEPQIGWNRELKRGNGITFALGARLMRDKDAIVPFADPDCCDSWRILPINPTISLAYEF